MTTRTSRGTKRIAATAAAAAMVGSVLAISGTAVAGPGAAAPTAERLSGDLRYGTAADVADEIADVSTITVASGQNFPDGLAGAFLDQAILLTQANVIPADTVEWLEANNAEVANIEIVGGTTVVSEAVAAELATYGTVTRLAGPDRYDTAVAIAESAAPNTTEIIIARGDNFPDALASGPLAIEADAPIILNAGASLRGEVTAYLDANDQITSAYIVGGATAIPASVAAELATNGITVERLGGATRDETAVSVANELKSLNGAYNDGVIVANRLRFADAMVAGPLGAERTSPILLVNQDAVPAPTAAYHVENCLTIAEIVAVGGTAVISDAVIATAVGAATCASAGENQTFTAAPELVSVTSLTADVVVFTFDKAIPGQALAVEDFRLYNVNGLFSNPTSLSISGSTVLARFPASGLVTFAQATQGGTRYAAVADATGLVNPAAAFPLQPSAGAAVSAYDPALIAVQNYRQGPVIVGDDGTVRVDFVFEAGAAAAYGFVEGLTTDFFIVGAQNGLFTGDTIVSVTATAGGTETVAVEFSEDPSELPESQLRRGYVDVISTGGDPIVLSSNFGTTGGVTVNPDLISIERVNATSFRFRFDEGVSALAADINGFGFNVFDEDGNVVQSTSAARSALAGDEARVVIANFAGLTSADVQVGGYVTEGAVVATDSTTFSFGENRADQKTLTLPPAPGAPPAGEIVGMPQLDLIVRATDIVSGDLNAVFVFDEAITAGEVTELRFGLYDANGIRFEETFAARRNDLQPGSDPSNTQVVVLFLNDDQIAAAVTGDVQVDDVTDATPATHEEQSNVIAIQN